nr:transposase [Legionella cincinnatiensis]
MRCVLEDLSTYFPKALSYPHFVALTGRVLEPLTTYVLSKAGEQTNLYYVDSTKLVACHNKRISGHRVFKGIAARGYSSVGYFLALNSIWQLIIKEN